MGSEALNPEEELNLQKQVAFYSAGVNAWYSTALEHDKSLFALSGGGIGLLLTLMNISAAEGPRFMVIFYVLATLCFAVCLVSVLFIFKNNKHHIEQTLTGTVLKSDPVLEKLDSIAMWAFGLGAVLTAVIVLVVAIHLFPTKEIPVKSKDSSAPTTLRESFNQVAKLQGSDFGKSFNGVGNIAPKPAAPAAPAAPTAPAAPPAATPPSAAPTNTSQGSGK